MKNNELAHLWAHQSRSQGTGSSLSFSGPVLRSYSTAIGELVQTKDGTLAVLNATDYNVSTSRHQHYARQAVSHLPSVEVWDIHLGEFWVVPKDAKGRTDKKWIREQIKTSLSKAAERMEKAGRARNPDSSHYLESQADYLVRNAETLAEWFKVRMPKVELGDLVARAAEIRKQEAARLKRLEAKLLKENAEKIEAWRNDPAMYFPNIRIDKVYLRRVRDLLEGGAKISVVSPNLLLTLSALFLTIFGEFALHPMIEAAKAGQATLLSFGALHGVSATLYWLKAVLVAILAWRLTGQR